MQNSINSMDEYKKVMYHNAVTEEGCAKEDCKKAEY